MTMLEIKVSTKKNVFSIRVDEEQLLIDVKSSPEKGKANLEIIKELSRLLKSEVRIVKGMTSKVKIIQTNKSREEILQIVRQT